MAADFDRARRNGQADMSPSREAARLVGQHPERQGSLPDDTDDTDQVFELPGADLSGEELTVRVVPLQRDEFTCSSCYLVHHRSQLAGKRGNLPLCRDCA